MCSLFGLLLGSFAIEFWLLFGSSEGDGGGLETEMKMDKQINQRICCINAFYSCSYALNRCPATG